MQENIDVLREAGIKLYAISYDEHAAQAEYAERQNVSFTLLSDPDSRVIREYGVLNTEISEEETLFRGIPFPGTFLIDESGKISDKLFGRHLATRDTAEAIVDRSLGRVQLGAKDPITRSREDDDIEVSAFLRGGGGTMRIGPRRRLVVRFSLPPGIHLYDAPVPDGLVPTSVSLDLPQGIREEMTRKPKTKPLSLPGLASDLAVWEGEVDFEVTIFANSALGRGEPELEEVHFGIEVQYQACDDEQCYLPKTRRLSLTVPVANQVAPNFEAMQGARIDPVEMDTMAHFEALNFRQQARQKARHQKKEQEEGNP